jgi:hypothetical protein
VVNSPYAWNKENCANYRPVSLSTSFSKVLIFYPMNNLDFIPKISTEIPSYSLINKVAGIFFDLGKALDCANHEILLYELEFYVYRLLKLYLLNRCQRVKIENGPCDKSESDWGQMKHGILQGSILAPLLFLLYIKDLPFIIKYSNTNANPLTRYQHNHQQFKQCCTRKQFEVSLHQ